MEYVALVFGIIGMVAFAEVCSLKTKVAALEAQLGKVEGTPQYEERLSLIRAAEEYIGKQVNITLKEEYQDVDVTQYGNTKYGSNTILDADDDWMLVQVIRAKGSKQVLIRMEAVQSLREV